MFRRAIALAAFCLLALPAAAQLQRNFPENALRGAIVFGIAPGIALNGRETRLAPGARIRMPNNMLVLPGGLPGGQIVANYTLDLYGQVKDVWLLTAAEAANRPWPTTPDQAAAWGFDPVAQVWVKP